MHTQKIGCLIFINPYKDAKNNLSVVMLICLIVMLILIQFK